MKAIEKEMYSKCWPRWNCCIPELFSRMKTCSIQFFISSLFHTPLVMYTWWTRRRTFDDLKWFFFAFTTAECVPDWKHQNWIQANRRGVYVALNAFCSFPSRASHLVLASHTCPVTEIIKRKGNLGFGLSEIKIPGKARGSRLSLIVCEVPPVNKGFPWPVAFSAAQANLTNH